MQSLPVRESLARGVGRNLKVWKNVVQLDKRIC